MHVILALVMIAHGAVHVMLAYHESRDEAKIVGGLWKRSWLLGEGPLVKRVQWIGAFVVLGLSILAGLSLLGWIVPQDWWRGLVVTSAGASLLLLVVYWFTEFWPGVVINVVLLVLVLLVNWNPLA